VQKGLLNRTMSLTSRRELAMSLTPKGWTTIHEVRALRHEAYASIIDRLPASAAIDVLAALEALRRAALPATIVETVAGPVAGPIAGQMGHQSVGA